MLANDQDIKTSLVMDGKPLLPLSALSLKHRLAAFLVGCPDETTIIYMRPNQRIVYSIIRIKVAKVKWLQKQLQFYVMRNDRN